MDRKDFAIRHIKKSRISGQEIFMVLLCLTLFVYIINFYEFGAILYRIIVPITLLLISSIALPRSRNVKSYIQMVGIICFALLSTFMSKTISISTSRVSHLAFCCLAFACFAEIKLREETIIKVIHFYVNFSFVLSIIIILGAAFGFGIDPYGRASLNFGTFYKDQNYLSAYLVPAFAIEAYGLFFAWNKPIVRIVHCMFNIVAVFLMGSRGSFLAILAAGLLILGKAVFFNKSMRKKVIFLLLLAVLTAGLYVLLRHSPLYMRMLNFESYKSDVRIRLWAAGMQAFWNNPILGSGIGSSDVYSRSVVGNAVHNSFVELLADQGIAGCIMIAWVYIDILKKTRKGCRYFVLVLLEAFFMPLFFLSGYSNTTFWVPMIFMKLLSNSLIDSMGIYGYQRQEKGK